MDAFDAVRESAHALHAASLARGADFLRPDNVVKIAAEVLDIEVHELPAGDPGLRGTLANYDAQSLMICCSNEGSAIDRALLVAHELGHARLHAGETRCEEHDIDAAATLEQAPVGLERVADYGARERRELHANIFARELVFPMTMARRLFLEDGMSAEQIAARTGLGQRLVRQQILDAVLLPRAPADANVATVERPPDESQVIAAHHVGTAFNLQAGPGTGKTRTLIERVRWLIEHGADPASILVLTFSNRAAGELSERFASAVPDAATQIWTGTFHAFGLDLFRRHYDRLGRSNNPRLFDRSDAIAALQDVLPTLALEHYRNLWNPAYSLREILDGISRAKDELTDCVRYQQLASEMLAKAVDAPQRAAAEKCLEIAQVYERYETVLREQDAVDFGDLVMRPTLLLESDPSLGARLAERHRHILVDEFQDVNRASARLLKALSGSAERLWVVGDARQSIYRFRGASPANLQLFNQDFNGKAGSLAVSYRSTDQLVETICGVAANLKASEHQLPLKLRAARGAGPAKPEIRVFSDPHAEAAGVVASIRELESKGVRLRDQAILCRSNARLVTFAAALEQSGIPVLHLGSLFERDDVRDLLALLSLSVDRFAAGLVRVGGWPRYGLTLQDVYIATKWVREDGRAPLDGLAACAEEADGLSERGTAGLKQLAADLDELTQSERPWDFLCTYLLDRTDAVREVAADTSIAGRMKAIAIWQFLNFAQVPTFNGVGSPVRRLLDRVRELVLQAEERGLREVPDCALHLDAVRLMTVHASKGLEFEAVHLPALTNRSFPSARRDRCPLPAGMVAGSGGLSAAEQAKADHDAEEECLFFVALSRAKTYARLYRHETTESGTKSGPSRFLTWLNALGVPEIRPSPASTAPVAASRTVRIIRAAAFHPDDAELVQYEACPLRYFYTHVLRLGPARRQTAFSRTHACVRALLTWYTNDASAASATPETLQEKLTEIWAAHGPTDHAFEAEYRALATRISDRLHELAPAGTRSDATAITLTFPSGKVIVRPHQVGRGAGGRHFIRRLNTGKEHAKEFDRLEYTVYRLAADQVGATLEAVFFTSGERKPVSITATKLNNRKDTITLLLDQLGRGAFPPEPNAVTCPNCPHFFICDSVPTGDVTIQ